MFGLSLFSLFLFFPFLCLFLQPCVFLHIQPLHYFVAAVHGKCSVLQLRFGLAFWTRLVALSFLNARGQTLLITITTIQLDTWC